MIDLTEALQEWTGLLDDLKCNIDDLETSILHYNPGIDSLFLDNLVYLEDPSLCDDVIAYIQRSSETLLRETLDNHMRKMGYEVIRIIRVFMTSLTGTVLSLVDVIPLFISEESSENCSRYN